MKIEVRFKYLQFQNDNIEGQQNEEIGRFASRNILSPLHIVKTKMVSVIVQ